MRSLSLKVSMSACVKKAYPSLMQIYGCLGLLSRLFLLLFNQLGIVFSLVLSVNTLFHVANSAR